MPPRFGLLRALPLLCCLLTAGASGDDFCLPRLIFGTALSGPVRLPLDDPNFDFLAPAVGQAASSDGGAAFDTAAAPGGVPALFAPPAHASLSPARPLVGAVPSSPQPSTIPLRC
jgi:hypothetical protein